VRIAEIVDRRLRRRPEMHCAAVSLTKRKDGPCTVFDQFTQLVADSSEWAYVIVFVFAFLDALIPIVPSETAVITAGVVAASGDLNLALIISAAAVGAFAGDNTSYYIGRRFGARATERFFPGEKARRRIAWADEQLQERGGELIAVGRFIPGGRIAVTLSAGALGYPWRRFLVFDAAAALGWALYSALLGYYGGKTFEGFWGLVLALVTAFAVAAGVELVRWVLRRRASAR
jgi:membrane-associated protein